MSEFECELQDLHTIGKVDFTQYDRVLIGASIRYGHLNKKLYQFINGYEPRQFNEQNLSSTELVNRLQIHHYPSGGGYMSYHTDPDVYLKTIAITYMSEYGKDYKSGGLYLQNHKSDKIQVDSVTNVGDMVFVYPTMLHGCAPIDKEESLNWQSIKGRWLFLFNTLQKVKKIN